MSAQTETPMGGIAEGTLLWEPKDGGKASRIGQYMAWLEAQSGLKFENYSELWRWSVTEIEAFWQSIAKYFDVHFHAEPSAALGRREMPGAEWFPGATLNYAEHALRRRDEHAAVVYLNEQGQAEELSYAELARRVLALQSILRELGVRRGDRVVGYVPNNVLALVAFLASASLGAIWSSASPEFGVKSVLDRFAQIEPKVLFAVDEYIYGGKRFSRREEIQQIRAGLPTLEHSLVERVSLEPLADGLVDINQAILARAAQQKSADGALGGLGFEAVPFDHPLYILYSSGTTGLPKPIVHGHGGILLEHLKALALHCDLGEEDRFFWFTTTGWMMWNFLVSGLLLGSTIMLFDGNPGYPDLNALWKMAGEQRFSYFGTSAPFLIACKKAGITPSASFDLSALRGVGSTGAPLPADGFAWVYEAVKRDVLLGSVSGGTDVCTAFVGSCPLLPVYAGEIQCAELGAKVEAYGPNAEPILNEVGELVISEPMPSMPVKFWNDEGGERYFDSYFSTIKGVWRHGDWIKFTERGSCVIYGRSDSTLNRGGVRMGSSEFYRVVDSFPEFADSLVVDTGTLDTEGELWLFLVLKAGAELDEELLKQLKRGLRSELSPRHVPDRIVAVKDIPKTISGKKLEVPIKRVLNGAPAEKVLNLGTLANPGSVAELLGAARAARGA